MGGTMSACAGTSGLCAGKEKKKKGTKEFQPEKYPRRRKRRDKKLREKVQTKDAAVAELKVTAGQLTASLSQHDTDLVDGKIKDSESRQASLLSSIDQKLQGYGQLETDLDSLRSQAQAYMDWLDQCDAKVKEVVGEGHPSQKLEARLEELKGLEQALTGRQTNLDSVSDNVHAMLANLPARDRREMEQLLATVQSRHNELFGQVSEQCRQLEDVSDQAREIQERLDQHRAWLLDTTQSTSDQCDVIRLAAVDVAKQLDKCKSATSKAQTKAERLNEIRTKVAALEDVAGCSVREELSQAVEASDLVKSSTEALQSKLASQTEAQGQITQCDNFLQAVQGELKKASRPIGFDKADAELMQAVFQSLEEKLSSYAPTMNQLREMREKLTEAGHVSLTDDITRLSDLQQSLVDQVKANLDTCVAAVSQRQAFGQLLEAQERLVSECEASSAQAGKQSVDERLQLYKSVLDKLQQLEPDLPITAEKAAHIGTQGTPDDVATATATVEKLATKLHAQKANVQTHLAQCEAMQRERVGFESSINTLMSWLEEKESALASCRELQLDSAKVKPLIAKHKATSAEAQEKIKTIKDQALAERSRYEAMSETLPTDVNDRLQQIEALEESIKSAITKKEKYLDDALCDRQQLENSMAQVTDWLRGASEMLDSGVSGLDYDTLEGTLSEFTDYFTEASLCQDELEQVSELSERLMPTLDSNDAATLEQTLSGVQRKYANVMSGSHSRQGHLEQKLQQWNNFQEKLASVNDRLDTLEGEWQEVDHSADASPDAVHSHLELVKTFMEHAETSRPMVDSLNQVARDLERAGSQESGTAIARLVQAVNDRWDALTGQVEARAATLEEITGQWGDFTSMLAAVHTVVHESETRLAIVSVDDVTVTQLCHQLDDLKMAQAELKHRMDGVTDLVTSLESLYGAGGRELPKEVTENVTEVRSLGRQLEEALREDEEKLSTLRADRAEFRKLLSSVSTWLRRADEQLQDRLTPLPQAREDHQVSASVGH
ncbi:nesprin-1-like [Elysia marginata]|uniref:Nesprin-1-like n=1 Tax=Elysia marginata TaxID=1093978 RepID=A0AAV4GI15_9GAST|nr:nesprin-1-like [Elysia marginata]